MKTRGETGRKKMIQTISISVRMESLTRKILFSYFPGTSVPSMMSESIYP